MPDFVAELMLYPVVLLFELVLAVPSAHPFYITQQQHHQCETNSALEKLHNWGMIFVSVDPCLIGLRSLLWGHGHAQMALQSYQSCFVSSF